MTVVESGKRKRGRKPKGSRDDILRIAASLFAERGFDAVTIREISKAVDVGLPTIYHFFGNKEQLYRAVVLSQQEGTHENVKLALQDVHEVGDLARWLPGVIDNSFERLDFEKLFLRELLADRESLREEMATRAFQPLYESFRDKFNELHDGLGDGILPIYILSVVMGFVAIYPLRKYLENYAPKLDQADLEAAERRAFAKHLFGQVNLEIQWGADGYRDGPADADLLHKAIVDLTLEKTQMGERIKALEARLSQYENQA